MLTHWTRITCDIILTMAILWNININIKKKSLSHSLSYSPCHACPILRWVQGKQQQFVSLTLTSWSRCVSTICSFYLGLHRRLRHRLVIGGNSGFATLSCPSGGARCGCLDAPFWFHFFRFLKLVFVLGAACPFPRGIYLSVFNWRLLSTFLLFCLPLYPISYFPFLSFQSVFPFFLLSLFSSPFLNSLVIFSFLISMILLSNFKSLIFPRPFPIMLGRIYTLAFYAC